MVELHWTHPSWNLRSEKEVLACDLWDPHSPPYRQLTELHVHDAPDSRSLLPVLLACQSLPSLYLDNIFLPRQYCSKTLLRICSHGIAFYGVNIHAFPNDVHLVLRPFRLPITS
ncbi:hypothetical protein E1B28_005163 [Marasmius oreades]|uniref:Uncharacterized protein n=1 Tax=Marasmius oreades TaxID=181124 RepID=A0A9P7V067_9AGAR|nr:uncharacterized protein E1B28_005163 [Marasmius oreades]KAG7097848.1 hypothetical protein E1B28_005163 [Marasmius oreades]